jgi:hypothetical protein
MKYSSNQEDKNQEAGEEKLAELIKQAGNDARMRKREALSRHFDKLKAVIAEAASHWESSISV